MRNGEHHAFKEKPRSIATLLTAARIAGAKEFTSYEFSTRNRL
jgi:hypothetical protein